MAQTPARGVYRGTLDGPQRRFLFDADGAAVLLPPDRILFVRAGTLYVQGFDTATLSLTGEPTAVAADIATDGTGWAAISASATGSVVFRAGSRNRQRQLTWVDREGHEVGDPFPPDPENLVNPSLSPDERRLAVNRAENGNADIWTIDLERRGAMTRVTDSPLPEISPQWAPNASLIYYGGGNGRNFGIYAPPAAAAGTGDAVLDSADQEIPVDVSPDGRFVLFRRQQDLSETSPQPLFPSHLNTTSIGGSGIEYDVAPDGRFLLNANVEFPNAPITLVLNLGSDAR